MGEEDVERGLQQGEQFKAKYGEYPALPIRIKYMWAGQKCEGDLDLTVGGGYSIFGFPGITNVHDKEVCGVVFLRDGENRPFPDIEKEVK